MLNIKIVATVATVAIVLIFGVTGMMTMMTQVSHAIIACQQGDHKCEGQQRACEKSGSRPFFCR